MKEVIQEAIKLLENGTPGVLATVVRTKGSTPQKAGAMLLVREDGTGVGTLGGGCVETTGRCKLQGSWFSGPTVSYSLKGQQRDEPHWFY